MTSSPGVCYAPAMSIRAQRAGAVLLAPLGVGLGLGCGEVDEAPPTIVDAHFEDASTLVLSFSEPVAATDDVHPESHFRLGVGFWLEDLGYTAYYDLSNHFTGEVPGQSGALTEQWLRHGDTQIVRIEPGDDPAQLRLRLNFPVDPYVCETLLAAEGIDVPAGIHLHYARANPPRITDLAGNELAEVASWWAIKAPALSSTRDGEFPDLNPRMPIPCPDG